VQVATPYNQFAKDVVWKLKFGHAPAAVKPITRVMADRLAFDARTMLVPVPTATSRARQRGFDHARLLARQLSRRTEVSYAGILARTGQARQVGANRKERAEHLRAAFWVKQPETVRGKHVVLIDDVLTTGATLEAAASVLRQAGAMRVDAIVFAQA
jgi:ComF family protein